MTDLKQLLKDHHPEIKEMPSHKEAIEILLQDLENIYKRMRILYYCRNCKKIINPGEEYLHFQHILEDAIILQEPPPKRN
uniref:Uncharacterized protein n=1 Tax=Thermoplasma acidophilum TaxID=2303 RepID=Q0KKX9_THEAI|nr:hypothetical protein [Cloning vector pSTA]BAF30831.1 hypothetical protein [Thermoplasma acidophilum]